MFVKSRLGILLFGHREIARLSSTDDVAIFFVFFFALDCYLELTLQYERICQLKAVPHRVRNVFWQEWDSNPRTHSCTRIRDWGISWVWRLRPSAILPGLRRHFSVWSVFFQTGWICISEIYSAKRFLSSISKDLRFNPRVHSCFTCLGWWSSLLCTYKPLGCRPWMTLRFFSFCFGLSSWINVPVWQNLSIEGSALLCSKLFVTGVGFEPTHTLVYQNSRLRNLLSLAP